MCVCFPRQCNITVNHVAIKDGETSFVIFYPPDTVSLFSQRALMFLHFSWVFFQREIKWMTTTIYPSQSLSYKAIKIVEQCSKVQVNRISQFITLRIAIV